MGNVDIRSVAIECAEDVLRAWRSCLVDDKSTSTRAVVDLKLEKLIELLMDNFHGELDADQVNRVFDAKTSALRHHELAEVPEAIVPVAVMREVLHTHKVMFDPRNVANWGSFAGRFGRVITGYGG
ncbi:hypothetical protein [Methylobacterium sp. Leaf85]|uniref:hypothetical protein n=1 Tax=Methylobacterium sp. Leaf85 TaxID=1736241 RepID=UPI0006FA96CE|nr:hypothetical protein [Methylobacterium sp. Leaf85]KQO43053.1 hypothetical protein ASF08_10785 [Methylobacterium sp. Leaf85]